MRETFRLGVDLGTTNTVAALQWPDGSVRPLLFDGSPTLPSAVCVDASGGLVAGRDAVHEGRVRPENFEASPKRCIDDVTVLLGEHEVPVVQLLAAVLRRVAVEAARVAGGPCAEVILTYPTTWGQRRRDQMLAAAEAAGLSGAALVPEPVAAAAWFARNSGMALAPDAAIVVYDFGGGTFDASAVRRVPDGFVVLAEEGLRETGGLDVDAAIVGYLGAVFGPKHPTAWQRLAEPRTPQDRRARLTLWDDVRTAKEALSRKPSTEIHVPLVDEIAVLGREHLDSLARPLIDRTVATTGAVMRAAGLRPDTVAALFLVGGSSRLPLAATMLHQRLGIAGTALEQPELVVAQGSLLAPRTPTTTVLSVDPVAAPFAADPVSPAGPPPGRPHVVASAATSATPATPATPASDTPLPTIQTSGSPFPASQVSGPPLPTSPTFPTSAPPTPYDATPAAVYPISAPPDSTSTTPPPFQPPPQVPQPQLPPAPQIPGAPDAPTVRRGRSRRTAALVAAVVVVLAIALTGYALLRDNGKGDNTGAGTGSSGSATPTGQAAAAAPGAGCAGVPGETLVLLTDDKLLQNSENVVPVMYQPFATPAVVAALDKVSDALDTKTLASLNKAAEVDGADPVAVATEFAARVGLTGGINATAGGSVVIGAAAFSENRIIAYLYRIVLQAAGYNATVQNGTNREQLVEQLRSGTIQVVPEYAATLTEFLNRTINGAAATPVASGKVETTMTELAKLAGQRNLAVGKASKAADQSGFAVTKALADRYRLTTLSQFAAACSGNATVLAGPPQCPTQAYCQPGLQTTYTIRFGSFSTTDTGGPGTKRALRDGSASIGMVFSTDSVFG